METPLGLTYKPFFPLVQSLFRQAEQARLLKAKQDAEEKKTAETRAYSAASDLLRYHKDRPYSHALEPYFQEQTRQTFEIARQVREGRIPTDAAYEQIARINRDVDAAKRYDSEVTTFMNGWKDSGNWDMEKITRAYANHTTDLTATQELGAYTVLPPSAVDPNNFASGVIADWTMMNQKALSEKFVASLKATDEDETATYDPLGNVVRKTKTLPSNYFGPMGSSGQYTLNLGPINGDQSKVLLNRFRSMGNDWDNYLQLRTAAENPEFTRMNAGSEEWGVAMQKTLQNVMNETGFIGSKTTESAFKPDTDAYDKTRIGGSGKAEEKAYKAADVLYRLINKDPNAVGFFKGPNIDSAGFDGNDFVIKMKAGRTEFMEKLVMGMLNGKDGINFNEETGEVRIPLKRESIIRLVNFKNAVSSVGDWVDVDIEEAYDKRHPEAKAPKGKVIDLSDAPSQADIDEFLQLVPAGTVYKTKDGKTHTKK